MVYKFFCRKKKRWNKN